VAKKDDLVTVTLPDGRSALVRAGDLIDPGEPKADCTVVVTKDNQLYQSVGGRWTSHSAEKRAIPHDATGYPGAGPSTPAISDTPFLVAYGWNEGVTLSWALVAHQILPPTEDGYDQSAYPVVYMGGSLPDHIAIGLFSMGLEFVHEDRHERRRDTDG
jgi:hypothetical protein